jgi:hypothetical protein
MSVDGRGDRIGFGWRIGAAISLLVSVPLGQWMAHLESHSMPRGLDMLLGSLP